MSYTVSLPWWRKLRRRMQGLSPEPVINADTSLVSMDDRTGSILIYAGMGGAASRVADGRWVPGDVFDRGISKEFYAVEDISEIEDIIAASKEALSRSFFGRK